MKTSNTTLEKQEKLIQFAKSLGLTIEQIKEWYKCPIKSSMLNAMAEGL